MFSLWYRFEEYLDFLTLVVAYDLDENSSLIVKIDVKGETLPNQTIVAVWKGVFQEFLLEGVEIQTIFFGISSGFEI